MSADPFDAEQHTIRQTAALETIAEAVEELAEAVKAPQAIAPHADPALAAVGLAYAPGREPEAFLRREAVTLRLSVNEAQELEDVLRRACDGGVRLRKEAEAQALRIADRLLTGYITVGEALS